MKCALNNDGDMELVMKITCLGDSLTYGNVGYSYIDFLDKSIHAVNRGKNGDTVIGARHRLEKILNQRKHDSPIYVLGIGTNDLLLPYLKTLSSFWFIMMGIRCKIKGCINNDLQFFREYDKLLLLLSKHEKRVIVFGQPFINLRNFPHGDLIKRNAIIKKLADQYGFPFIDIYRLQKERIEEDTKVYMWKHSFLLRVIDATIMSLAPFTKDRFAKRRGLTTSVDGAHFNSKSAKILAKEVEKHLLAYDFN